MCLAIYKPDGVEPDWEAYETGYINNPDGAGFAVADDGIIVRKGFFTFDDFKAALEPYASMQCAIHFRLTSHGKTNRQNCHPFLVRRDLALIHNGVLDIELSVNKDMSDTWHYSTLLLKPMSERDPQFFLRDEMIFVGGSAISGSKFVFLQGDGKHAIWNEQDGHWHGDCWWSNSSYKQARWVTQFAAESRSIGDYLPSSKYENWLRGEAKWAYEDLLDEGWSAAELDAEIAMRGEESLIELAEEWRHD